MWHVYMFVNSFVESLRQMWFLSKIVCSSSRTIFAPFFWRWGVWCSCLWSVGRCDSAQPPGMAPLQSVKFGGNLPYGFFVAPLVCLTKTPDFRVEEAWLSFMNKLVLGCSVSNKSYGCSGPWDESTWKHQYAVAKSLSLTSMNLVIIHQLPITMWFIHSPSRRLCRVTMPVVET